MKTWTANWVARLVIAGTGLLGLTACERNEPTTRLVYLTNSPSCVPGQPEGGKFICDGLRKAAAKVVLRMPKNFGGSDMGERPFHTEAPLDITNGQLVLMPDGRVLTSDDKDVDYYVLEKLGWKNFRKFDRERPAYIVGVILAWGYVGRQDELSRRLHVTPEFAHNGQYVEVKPFYPGFKTYDLEKCVGHAARLVSGKGKVSPNSTCDNRTQYLMPVNRPDVYFDCAGQAEYDGKIELGSCRVLSSFVLRTVAGKPFHIYYTFDIPASANDWIENRHWEYIDQRLRSWIKSMDVTEQELSLGTKP